MMVLLHATGEFPEIQFMAAEWAGVQVYGVGELQDFSSRLYRDPDAIGVLHCHLPDIAPQIVRGMRDGGIDSRLLVLLRERGTESTRAGARALVLIAGADDAQPDTVDQRELVARLQALSVREREQVFLIALTSTVSLNPHRQELSCGDAVVHLTKNETLLLELLASRQGSCVTKTHCMEALYGGRDEAQVKIIDVFLCKLRRKLRAVCGDRTMIETVWGQGYRFRPDEAAA